MSSAFQYLLKQDEQALEKRQNQEVDETLVEQISEPIVEQPAYHIDKTGEVHVLGFEGTFVPPKPTSFGISSIWQYVIDPEQRGLEIYEQDGILYGNITESREINLPGLGWKLVLPLPEVNHDKTL